MKPRGPTEGSAPVVCAAEGSECWEVKAQFAGILFLHQHHSDVSCLEGHVLREAYQSLG